MNGALTITTLLLLAVLLCAPAVGDAQTFTPYDTFDAAAINPLLWSGFEQNTNPDAIVNLEVVRKIVQPDPLVPNRFLQESLTTAHTGTGSNAGRAGEGRLSLRINRENLRDSKPAITGISIKGLVVSATAQDCPTNSEATIAGALIFGFFFNDGTSTGAGDRTGDVFAGIEVALDSNAGRQLVAFLKRCDDSTCTAASDVTSAAVFTRTWTPGSAGRITVKWDRTNNRFVYTLGNPVSPQETQQLDYSLSDTNPPVTFLHDLRVFNNLPNCSTAIKASMTTRIDFVSITTEDVFP